MILYGSDISLMKSIGMMIAHRGRVLNGIKRNENFPEKNLNISLVLNMIQNTQIVIECLAKGYDHITKDNHDTGWWTVVTTIEGIK